jgi:hypothetical protein
MAGYPKTQRPNFEARFLSELEEALTDGVGFSEAFASVSLDWLGYEQNTYLKRVDSKGDRAVDYYKVSTNEVEVFQFKSQDFTKVFDVKRSADPSLLADVRRIIEFFRTLETPSAIGNKKVQQFRNEVISELAGIRDARDALAEGGGELLEAKLAEPFQITINLVGLFDGLSAQAAEELERIRSENVVMSVHGVDVLCEINTYFIDDLIGEKWKKSNAEWRDHTGKQDEWPEFETRFHTIDARKCIVSFVKAKDLINAYNRFG